MPYFDSKKISGIMYDTLENKGVIPDSVNHAVSSLVQTSLRGVDSHGINLFTHYCRAIDAGRINKKPKMEILRTASAVAIVDADHALGHHAGAEAMDIAIATAMKTGIGAVGVKNSTHFGAAAYFGLRAANRDCLGLAFTDANALVKAYGAKEMFFGTNPICFTAPMEREEPFCLDMATSFVSWNKIENYRREDKEIPVHWAFNEAGGTVTDPHRAKTLNPIGEYKGFGLGMAIDILCALLIGGPMSKDILSMYEGLDDRKRRIGHFFMAIDISKFSDPLFFKRNLQSMADRIRRLDPLKPNEAVMIPGDPEKKTFIRRIKEGVPVDDIKVKEFLDISTKFNKAIIK